MTKTLSAIDRVLVFLLGALLIAAGLIPVLLYWNVPYASAYVARLDRSGFSTLPDAAWFPYALVAGLLLTLAAGAWIVLANVRSRTFSYRRVTPAVADHGETVFNVQRLAQAACDYLETSPAVTRATQSVAMVGSRPTVTFTVTTDPELSLPDATRVVEAADRDFTAACGAMDIDTVFKLHLDRIGE